MIIIRLWPTGHNFIRLKLLGQKHFGSRVSMFLFTRLSPVIFGTSGFIWGGGNLMLTSVCLSVVDTLHHIISII